MAKSDSIFKRYEYKYLLTKEQYAALRLRLGEYVVPDEFGKSSILSLYYDTPERVLIRRSLEGPMYKEKLRLRSYGVAKEDTKVYVELKKKYDGVVYKRRVGMKCSEAREYLSGKCASKDTQIVREIDYFKKFYKNLEPAMMLSYDRLAFCGKEDSSLRITFDSNILYREDKLSLTAGIFGKAVIPEDMYLLELKVAGAMPLWLVSILSELKIYKTSFSKYGTAYKMSQKEKRERLKECI